MGHIVKKIMGDVNKDPDYENLTIEYNSDGMAHIHLGPLRLDLVKSAYNQLYDGVMEAKKAMSKIHGWTEVINSYDNGWGTKYYEISAHGEEFFFVPMNKDIRWGKVPENLKQVVTRYSNSENKIIEIKNPSIEVGNNFGVLTKLHSGWTPLVILDVCDFYSDEIFQRAQSQYHKKLADYYFANDLYNSIIDQYQNFYNATGLYFSDISSNNILTSPDFADYRIIDVESVDYMLSDVEVPPHRVLCGHYPPNRSNSVLPGPAGKAAKFLKVDASKNDTWPKNLPDKIKETINKIKPRKIKVNR